MSEYLIVDGYNIIGAWPELRKLADLQLEEARDRLIQILSEYQGYSGMNIIIVFDAYHVPGLAAKYRQGRVDVRFTKEKETADECIEKLVIELARRGRNLFVATSDYVEQHITFGKGALRISARELLLNIQESRKGIQKQIKEQQLSKRNTFDYKLSKELKERLEKWRRGK